MSQGFFRDADGRLVLGQAPNPAIIVFFAALALRWSQWDARDTELLWLGRGALIAWAADEILRGDALVRRLLGAVVLAWQLFVLFR
ncbi:hypothetical protein [Aeromicrobium sp.]|uniref:hypothetical protein n=1 Tax=Aeromicrobium sp. TaxID=1871063 RepID=UPI003D6B113F